MSSPKEELKPDTIIGIPIKELARVATDMYYKGWNDAIKHQIKHIRHLNIAVMAEEYAKQFIEAQTKSKIFVPADKKIIIPPSSNNTPN